MRIPKYRAYIKSLKVMVPVMLIDFQTEEIQVDLSEGHGDVWEYRFNEVELMQWTGLEDKNGVEIFEGDVIRRDYEIGNTVYDPNTLGVEGYEITDSGYFIGAVRYRPSEGFVLGKVRKYNDDDALVEKKSAVKIYPRYAKVIGDIHSNPELLEVGQ